MCWGPNISLVFVLLLYIESWWLYYRQVHPAIWSSLLFLSTMESIQGLQYLAIWYEMTTFNWYLTILAYFHICLQPLFNNIMHYGFSRMRTDSPYERRVRWSYLHIALPLCMYGGLTILSRLKGVFWMVDKFYEHLATYHVSDLNCKCTKYLDAWVDPAAITGYNSTFAFQETISSHVGWMYDLHPLTYTGGHISMHGFLYFALPTVIEGHMSLINILQVIGMLSGLVFAGSIHETAALWCHLTPIVMLTHMFYVLRPNR